MAATGKFFLFLVWTCYSEVESENVDCGHTWRCKIKEGWKLFLILRNLFFNQSYSVSIWFCFNCKAKMYWKGITSVGYRSRMSWYRTSESWQVLNGAKSNNVMTWFRDVFRRCHIKWCINNIDISFLMTQIGLSN